MFLISDLPTVQQERVACSIMAAIKYEVPVNIVLAIAEKEAGKPGQWVKNTNGTFDVGSMQFNTYYLTDLKKYGISAEDVAQDGCYSFDLAAWRIRGHLQHDSADIWTRAANYHSKTPKYNQIYRKDLINKAMKWKRWLEHRFETYTVSKPGLTPVFVESIAIKTESDAFMETSVTYTLKNEYPVHYNKDAAQALAKAYAANLRKLT